MITPPSFFIKNICLLAIGLLANLCLFASPLAAQEAGAPDETLPSMTLSPDKLKSPAPPASFSAGVPTFNYPNPYLNDTLSLQYQNILLQKMIVRQGTIVRTEKSFMDVGVPFREPPPPRGICEQIPVNIPCYKAYPDLYPGALPDVEEIEEGAINDPSEADFSSIPPIETKTASPEPVSAPAPDTSSLGAYSWAEIMCAGGKCSAVLIKDGVRQTVRAGDTVDDDVKIVSISSSGVEAEQGGKTKKLDSALAPSRGGVGSPKYAGSQGKYIAKPQLSGDVGDQAEQLESFFSNQAQPPAEGATEEAPAAEPLAANAPTNDPGPPLGSTGLY